MSEPRWDDWPSDGALLLHPALGLISWSKGLPVEERQLPHQWLSLPEDEQDSRLDSVAAVAFQWALDEGAERVRVETYDKSDKQALTLGAFSRVDGHRFVATADSGTMTIAASLTVPERIWVTRDGRVILYVHETWDSVLVDDTADALHRLRERLPTH